MGKVIIGIHGLGNKPPKDILQKWWEEALQEGLAKVGEDCSDLPFELVYWADILYEKPLDINISDKEDPLYVNEKYVVAEKDDVFGTMRERRRVLDFLEKQLDRIFLDDDLSINFSFVTDAIIHRYFKDLEIYYSDDVKDLNDQDCLARDAIRARLESVLKKYAGEDIILIGHSMGSIIAYDVLTFQVPELKIDTFVTIGSPLGFPVVISKIVAERGLRLKRAIKPKTPPGVTRSWINCADLEDKVALIYDLSENYYPNFNGVRATDFIVHNNYSVNGEPNPHKSFGYLRAPELSGIVCDFLKRDQNIISKFYHKIKRLMS